MSIESFREDEQTEERLKLPMLKRLLSYFKEEKRVILFVTLVMLMGTALRMAAPLLVERMLNKSIPSKNVRELLLLGGMTIFLYIASFFLMRWRLFRTTEVCNRILMKIRLELYAHIQELSLHFFDSRPTGKILARIIGDVNSLKDLVQDSITSFIPSLFTLIGVLIIMIVKNVHLALAALITLPFVIFYFALIQRLAHKRWRLYRKKNSNLNAYLHENFSGIQVIQSYHTEEQADEDFVELVRQHRKAYIGGFSVSDAFGPGIDIFWGVGTALLYYIGIHVLGIGNVGVGTFVAFTTYLGMFWNPIQRLGNLYNRCVTNLSAAERVFEILDEKPEISEKEKPLPLDSVKGELEFDHVSFAYPDAPEKKILQEVSFRVRPGETIALVGETGAGKTTIVNLIPRFFDVTGGCIRLDGKDIRDLSIRDLRRHIGFMTQETFLFTGTIRENLLYGRRDATEEEMVEAARAVHAHDFIMELEKGYDTELSERGGGLSVGQQQLIAFARTLILRPSLLILDEATSSIDTKTEKLLQEGIQLLMKGRTSFVIAHRLSTVRHADRIFVIGQGGILEEGSHEELLRKGGAYAALYDAQWRDN